MTDTVIRWAHKQCPVCNKKFYYIEGRYEPKTCNQFECIHAYLHDPKYKNARKEVIVRNT